MINQLSGGGAFLEAFGGLTLIKLTTVLQGLCSEPISSAKILERTCLPIQVVLESIIKVMLEQLWRNMLFSKAKEEEKSKMGERLLQIRKQIQLLRKLEREKFFKFFSLRHILVATLIYTLIYLHKACFHFLYHLFHESLLAVEGLWGELHCCRNASAGYSR